MSNVKLAYAGATAITISLNSLASAGSAVSSAIDNTTNDYLDYLIEVLVDVGTVSGTPTVDVYAIDSLDSTNFSDSTVADNNMVYLGSISTPTSSTSYRSRAFSIAQAFGSVPPQFEIVVVNNTGAALAGSGNGAQQNGVYQTVI